MIPQTTSVLLPPALSRTLPALRQTLKNELTDMNALTEKNGMTALTQQRMNDLAELAQLYPATDVYGTIAANRVQYVSRSETKGVRHLHTLTYTCQVTMPGRGPRFLVKHCGGCDGWASKEACRHAIAVTAILNHPMTLPLFRAETPARIVIAYQCKKEDGSAAFCTCGALRHHVWLYTPGQGYLAQSLCLAMGTNRRECGGGRVL